MTERKPLRENAQSRGLDPRSDNPALNDEIHAATSGQGEVTPEDYPASTRKAQVEAATGKPGPA